MHTHNCLNCETEALTRYCHNCGQKTATHRISIKHFLLHDLLHGIWHFDKGLLYTLKEVFLRPGKTAAAYIKGKRIGYYNFFYLLLLLLGLNVLMANLLRSYYHINEEIAKPVIAADTLDITQYVDHNFKLLVFLLIPFFAISGKLVFRKLNYNLAEHAIVAGNILLAGAIWWFIAAFMNFVGFSSQGVIWDMLGYTLMGIITLVPVQVYWQVTRKRLTVAGFCWRMVLWYIVFVVELVIILALVFLFSGKSNIAVF